MGMHRETDRQADGSKDGQAAHVTRTAKGIEGISSRGGRARCYSATNVEKNAAGGGRVWREGQYGGYGYTWEASSCVQGCTSI